MGGGGWGRAGASNPISPININAINPINPINPIAPIRGNTALASTSQLLHSCRSNGSCIGDSFCQALNVYYTHRTITISYGDFDSLLRDP